MRLNRKNEIPLVKILKDTLRKGIIRTLIMWFLIIALVPLTVVSIISFQQSKESLRNSIIEAQQTTIALKTEFINNWFSYRFRDLENQSTNIENIRFLEELRKDFQASGKEIGDYVGSYRWASIVDDLNADLKSFRRTYGYYDLFLIDSEGNILYTVIGAPDLGTNLFNGPYSGTLFASTCKQAFETGRQTFSDFELYAPSNNSAAGFLAAPIIDENGEKIGVFALQIPIDRIDRVMNNRSGLGKTGETYLVGSDLTLRSHSSLHEDEKILITMVDTKQTRKWHREHITGTIGLESEVAFIYKGHNGKDVLGTHSLVEVAGVRWALITEIDEVEVFAPILRQRAVALILGITTVFIVLIASFVLSWRIVSPLLGLTEVAKQIYEGKKNVRANVSTGNEIEILANTFNLMLDILNDALNDTEKARDKTDGILKSIADGLIVTDNQNRVILMNRIAENILNVRFSEVINRPIDYAIKEEPLRDRIKYTLDRKESGYQFDFELAGDDKDHPNVFRARTSLIKDKEGKLTGIITIFHNVTHEREVDRMKTEFISTAAHELRTPLTSIQGFSEILLTRDDIDDQEKKKFLDHINKQSTNLTHIINDLLDISRIESGRSFILQKELCPVGEAIEMVAKPFISQSTIHKFEIIIPKKPVEITVDKDKMAQVLYNLISNAVKYSPDGGKIQIKGEVIKDNYQVSIQDEGIGMTPEQVEKVFDKFYRVDASNTANEGTGLGMSIVNNIVEAHGGKVFVESELGKGTKVTFNIPLDQNA